MDVQLQRKLAVEFVGIFLFMFTVGPFQSPVSAAAAAYTFLYVPPAENATGDVVEPASTQ